jgi:spermidine synthase
MSDVQSRMDIRRPEALELDYTRLMMGFLMFLSEPKAIAMIGLGGGSLAKFCHRYVRSARISVVEINPHVIALREEFHVPCDSERFRIIEGDGSQFVRFPPNRFDALLVDGYDYDGQPQRLCSRRFYDHCFDLLVPGGVLAVNLHSAHPQHSEYIERIGKSFNGSTLTVNDDEGTNAIVFGNKGHAMASLRMGPLRRPRQLDDVAWTSLQGSFARILSALKASSL